MKTIKRSVKMTPNGIWVDGIKMKTSFESLNDVYRHEIGDYPKFFKMDALCKLGFITSELLLRPVRNTSCHDENMAVIMFNRSSSLCNDKIYQETTNDGPNSFPSPSLFVYTLPNIVTGEIAIRNKLFGETSFYVLEEFNAGMIMDVVNSAFQDPVTKRALCGWLDCMSTDDYIAVVYLIEEAVSSEDTVPTWDEEGIKRIFNS